MTRGVVSAFDEHATGYARTVGQTLLPVAHRVVDLAALRPGEAVLDVGTGTGTAAGFATGEGRSVFGIDAAPGMIALARTNVPAATFKVMDFAQTEFADGIFDVVIGSHSLLFAADRVAALREWWRVTRRGGRLAISVPGPQALTPTAIYHDVYARFGIDTSGRYPTASELGAQAAAAGWEAPTVGADEEVVIRLATEELFRTWRGIGTRAETTRDWTPDEHEALTREMLAVTPRDAGGTYVIPFGVLYLTASRAALDA